MIRDKLLLLSESQALTATAVGTNTIDLGVARSIGTGEPMSVVISVITAADVADGDEDYTFEVEYATDAAQTTGLEPCGEVKYESGTPTAGSRDADLLVAGHQIVIGVPPVAASETARYFGVRYTLAGTTPSVTVDACLVPTSSIGEFTPYADGFTIS